MEVGFTGHGKNRVPWVLIKKDPLSGSEDIQWPEGQVELEPISKIVDHAQEQGTGR